MKLKLLIAIVFYTYLLFLASNISGVLKKYDLLEEDKNKIDFFLGLAFISFVTSNPLIDYVVNYIFSFFRS